MKAVYVALALLIAGCGAARADAYVHSQDPLYGAVCDDVADDTAALQSAINAARNQGLPLFLDSGTCKITAPLTINSTGTIIGAGRSRSIIHVAGNFDGLQATNWGGSALTLTDFGVTGQPGATAGALINLSPPSGLVWQVSLTRLSLLNGYDGLVLSNAVGVAVEGNYIQEYAHAGITVSAPAGPDNGDSSIHGNIIQTSRAATGILQFSSGGLKIVQNKIIGGTHGYWLALGSGVSTYDLLIVANSIENQTTDGITMTKGGGTVFGDVVISANQFSNMPYPINLNDAKSGFPTRMSITGNVAYPSSGGTCIAVNGAANFTIASNTCLMRGTSTGINIGSLSTKGLVTYNNIISATNAVVNNSGTQTRVVQ